MKQNHVWLGIVFCFVLAFAIPITTSYVITPEIPLLITNHSDQSKINATLITYAITGATCKDSDSGIQPSTIGTITFTDTDTGYQYTLKDFCHGKTLIEFGCVDDFTINNKQYEKIAIATEISNTSVCG